MKKIISFTLAVVMIIGIIPLNSIYASSSVQEKNDYIIITSYKNQEYLKLRNQGEYLSASKMADGYLDEKENILKEMGIDNILRLRILYVAFYAKLNKNQVEEVKKLDFVKDVILDVKFDAVDNLPKRSRISERSAGENLKMISSPELVGIDDSISKKYTGKGRLLAVFDSDFNPAHDAFSQAPPNPKLSYEDVIKLLPEMDYWGAKATREAYYSEKIPFAWNYKTKSNLNPNKVLAGHGQHIAGTMVGKTMNINGRMWRGIAPDAQLAITGPTDSSMAFATEHAMILGADAINFSLGTTKGKREQTDAAITEAFDKAYLGGLNVVVAAGNEGEYKGDISILTPDIGNIDNPAIFNNVISVGSIENRTIAGLTIKVNGFNYSISPSNIGGMLPKGKSEYVFAGYGREEDFNKVNVSGKIALIKRGENFFMDKIQNAQERNAIGVIVYNNVSGSFGMELNDKAKIPSVGITLEDGEILKNQSNKVLEFTGETTFMQNPKFGEISSFSNYGLTAYGHLKPDLLAAGGEIYSTDNSKDGFTNMSGTSMAAPHVTAAIALLREYMDKDSKYKNINKEDISSLVKTLLMNSAVPHMDPITKVASSTRRQGAGVVDIKRATTIDFTVVDAATDIPSTFINNVDNTLNFNLKFKNYANEAKKIIPSIATTIEGRDGNFISKRPGELFSRTLTDKAFSLNAGEEKTINISIPIENVEQLNDFKNGAFIDGFLTFKDENNEYISFPFTSFKGNFDKLSMVEKPVYEFDFKTEHPLYWNYKFEDHPWHKYSTHIETKIDGKEVIAGVSNFSEIELNDIKRTEPNFSDIVLSPNNDGKNDELKLVIVPVRDGSVSYKIVKESEKIFEEEYPRHVFKGFSFNPDENNERMKGFVEFSQADIKNYEDGEYSLEIGGSPIRETNTGEEIKLENNFTENIKFRIDRTPPKFEFVSYNDKTRELIFNVSDKSKIRELYYELNGAKKPLKEKRIIVPQGVNLEDIKLYAVDEGYNVSDINLDILTKIDDYGIIRLKINAPTMEDDLNLKVKLVGEDKKEYDIDKMIPYGKYKLNIESFYPLYSYDGKKVYDIDLNGNNKEQIIELKFAKKDFIKKSLYLRGNYKDQFDKDLIDVYAKSKAGEVYKFKYDNNKYLINLPDGKYELYYEYKDPMNAEKYNVYFYEKNIEIPSSNSLLEIYVDKKYDLKINYVLNAEEEIKSQIGLELTNEYGQIVSKDDLKIDTTYFVKPTNIPQGYISVPSSREIRFTNNELEKIVQFNILSQDKSYKLKINDNIQEAKYFLYNEADFEAKTNRINIENKEINLKPGLYYLGADPQDKIYFAGSDKEEKNIEFLPITIGEDTTVNAKWKEYTSKKWYKYFNVKENNSDKKIFTIVLKDIENNIIEKINYDSEKRNPGTSLKQGTYFIEIPELSDNYNVVPNKFSYTEFDQGPRDRRTLNLKIVPIKPIPIEFKFIYNGNYVENIKYTIDDKKQDSYKINLGVGNHNLKIDSDIYKLTQEPRPISIKRNSKIIEIKLISKDEDFAIPDKSIIKKLIDEDKVLEQIDDFKKLDNKEMYLKALEDAKKAYVDLDIDKNSMDKAANKLLESRNTLIGVYKDYLQKELNKLIEKSKKTKETYIYTAANDELKEKFDNILLQAESVNKNMAEEKIAEIYFSLIDSLNNLNGKKPLDTTELEKLVSDYKNVINSYKFINATNEEKRAYQFAISDAKDILESQTKTNEKIEDMVKRIKEALESLSGQSFDESTKTPQVNDVYVGDDKITGKTDRDAEVIVNINGEIFTSTAIDNNGDFVVSVPKIKARDIINVSAIKKGYLKSDEINIRIMTKENNLGELIDEYDRFINSEYFKNSSNELQEKYINAVNLAKRFNVSDLTNEEIEDLINHIQSAKNLITNDFVKIEFKSNDFKFNEEKLSFIYKKKIKIEDAKLETMALEIPTIESKDYKLVGWTVIGDDKVYKIDLSDYDKSINEDIVFWAKTEENKKTPQNPESRPDPVPYPIPEEKTDDDNSLDFNNRITYFNFKNTKDKIDNVNENRKSKFKIGEKIYNINLKDIPKNNSEKAIKNMLSRGILQGMNNGKFEPQTTISRAMVTEVLMRISSDKTISDKNMFKDVKEDDWFSKSVIWAANHKLVYGYEDGTFKANKKISLQELGVIINKMIVEYDVKMPKVKSVSYKDYEYLPKWSRQSVINLVEMGLIDISENGENKYDEEVTREYFAVTIDKLVTFVEKSK